jgi:hypothetical protein
MYGRRLAAIGLIALLTLVLVVGSDVAASAQSKETTKLTKTCWEISNDIERKLKRKLERRLGLVSVQHADRLVLYRQQYDTAEELYRAVLARDPGDRCAIRGLARSGQARAKAAAEAAAGSPPKRAAKAWDDFYADWLAPATDLAVPALALLLVLLVLSRLTTRLVVGVDRREWPEGWRRASWWVGFAMLAAAACTPFVASHTVAESGGLGQGWRWLHWLLGFAVFAVLGGVFIGFGWGLRLRLQVDARDAGGSEDFGAGRYVVARLQGFGSAPPQGLEIPSQADVTTLPDDALTTLPEGRVIAALFKVFRVLLPTVPWRAIVSLTPNDSATVTLQRNGRVVEITRISRSALHLAAVPDGGGTGDDGQAHLLTASAARILFALAERHPRLEDGLCGAKRWESGALHVLGVEAPSTDKQRLLAAAVAFDHGNALARVAYLHCFGRRGDAVGQLRFASLMDALYQEVFGTGGSRKGFEALEVRMLFSLVASNLNAELLLRQPEGGPDTARKGDTDPARKGDTDPARKGDTDPARKAWHDARGRTEVLISKLANDHPDDERLQEFVVEARPSAYYLWRSVDDRARFSLDDRELAEWTRVRDRLDERIKGWEPALRPDWPTPLSSWVYYERACWNAERQYVDDEDRRRALEQAIDDLREAATDEGLRNWAPQDPSLRIFRDPDTTYDLRQRYQEIIGRAGDAPSAPVRGAVRRPAMARRRRVRQGRRQHSIDAGG